MFPRSSKSIFRRRGASLFVALIIFIGIQIIIFTRVYFRADTSINLESEEKPEIKTFIITGATDNHFQSMIRLVQQIAEKMGDYNIELIMADLGLRQENKDELFSEAFRHDLETRGAKFSMATQKFEYRFRWISDVQKYAWKPLIIQEIIETFGAQRIFWIDAGCVLNERFSRYSWDNYLKTISHNGITAPELESIRTIREWTHQGMLDYFMVPPNSPILEQPQFAGGVLGIDLRVKDLKRKILDPWFDCASRTYCIAPKGSNLDNHRYDQAALSIIMRLEDWPKDKKLINERYRFITVHQDLDKRGVQARQYQFAVENMFGYQQSWL
eukprot:484853_1